MTSSETKYLAARVMPPSGLAGGRPSPRTNCYLPAGPSGAGVTLGDHPRVNSRECRSPVLRIPCKHFATGGPAFLKQLRRHFIQRDRYILSRQIASQTEASEPGATGRQARVACLRRRAWMLVFSSAEMTNSPSCNGSPCHSRAYRSSRRPAFSAKLGSRGKIQLRWYQGRMARGQ